MMRRSAPARRLWSKPVGQAPSEPTRANPGAAVPLMLGTGPMSERLTPELLIRAYCSGVFPMADHRDGRIGWYRPDPRAIMPLDAFHVSRSLRRTIRRGVFQTTVNLDFAAVIAACAAREETWISDEVIEAYT